MAGTVLISLLLCLGTDAEEATQARLEKARETAEAGSRALAQGSYKRAARAFRTSMDWLLHAEDQTATVSEALDGYTARFADAAVALAKERAAAGELSWAIELAAEVLRPAIDPNHAGALSLLNELAEAQDLKPEHQARLGHVRNVVKEGIENDEAYLDKLHGTIALTEEGTRFGLIFQVQDLFSDFSRIEELDRKKKAVAKRLKEIIIPEVDFENTPLNEALEILDKAISESGGSGPEINIKLEGFSVAGDNSDRSEYPKISLHLTNVPAYQAIFYTTDLARVTFMIGSNGVLVNPLGAPPELLVASFRLPPDFVQLIADDFEGLELDLEVTEDPFRQPSTNHTQINSAYLREFLESQGIAMGPENLIHFKATTNLLNLKHTQSQIDLVEAVIESAYSGEDLSEQPRHHDPALGEREPEEYGATSPANYRIETDELPLTNQKNPIVRVYHIPPLFRDFILGPRPTNGDMPLAQIALWKADYQLGAARMIVRTSPEVMKEVEALVEEGWEKAKLYRSPILGGW